MNKKGRDGRHASLLSTVRTRVLYASQSQFLATPPATKTQLTEAGEPRQRSGRRQRLVPIIYITALYLVSPAQRPPRLRSPGLSFSLGFFSQRAQRSFWRCAQEKRVRARGSNLFPPPRSARATPRPLDPGRLAPSQQPVPPWWVSGFPLADSGEGLFQWVTPRCNPPAGPVVTPGPSARP